MQPPPPMPAQTMPYAPIPTPPESRPGYGLGIAGLIIGIASGVCLLVFPFIVPIPAILGLVLSIVAKKQGAGGLAIAGIIISAIATVISLVFLAGALMFLMAAMSGP